MKSWQHRCTFVQANSGIGRTLHIKKQNWQNPFSSRVAKVRRRQGRLRSTNQTDTGKNPAYVDEDWVHWVRHQEEACELNIKYNINKV